VDKPNSWEKILEHLRSRLDERDFDTWFRESRQRAETAESITVQVKTPLFVDYISENFATHLAESARLAGLGEREIRFGADGAPSSSVDPKRIPAESRRRSGLNPLYTFEQFVTGSSNRLAHAAAQRVAEQSSRQYNPLFIHGGVGLGKTHLMQAIGHRRQARHPGEKIVYITSEAFVNEVVLGVRFSRMESVRGRFRAADVLLLDDVQFLGGKEASENELFHTFNALYEDGKQIVFTSDVPPRDVPGLTERMKSRFEGGLSVDVQAPDVETKIAILKQKSETYHLELSDEVAFFLAKKTKANIRELEGHLNKIAVFAEMKGEPVTLELVEEVLRNVLPAEGHAVSPAEIVKAVAQHYGLKPSEMRAKTKRSNVVFPRQVAMYVLKETTNLSLPEIGRIFSDKHHTTALHSIRKIASQREEDAELDRLLKRFIAQYG